MVCWPAASTTPGSFFKIQDLSPHPKSDEPTFWRAPSPTLWLHHMWNVKKFCSVTLHRPWCEAGIAVNDWVALKAGAVLIGLWKDDLTLKYWKCHPADITFLWPFLVLSHGDPLLLLNSLICYLQVTLVVVWVFCFINERKQRHWPSEHKIT